MVPAENIINQLKAFESEERNKAARWLADLERRQRSSEEIVRHFYDKALRYLMPASPLDYACWLVGYMRKGGKPTHFYDYAMPRDFYFASHSFRLPALHGASSVNLIVAPDAQISHADLGHNNLFYLKDFSAIGNVVPVYSELPLQAACATLESGLQDK